ncbi:MAG: YlxR family protein [Deltaproteobacteria bacterium]|nr:MAG: YlxR family protein [Deltaproteobacteria bacterium]
MSRHVAMRTCVGCGRRAPQAELLRLTAASEGLRLDTVRRSPGRGAYLHRVPICWAAFVRRRGPVRSLRLTPGHDERQRLFVQLGAAPETSR